MESITVEGGDLQMSGPKHSQFEIEQRRQRELERERQRKIEEERRRRNRKDNYRIKSTSN